MSSLFVPSNCQLSPDTWVEQAAWSKSDQLIALAVKGIDENDNEINQVVFSNNEGEINHKHAISHETEVTVMEWHPTDRIIGIGWADGMISCWMMDGKSRPSSCYSNNSEHSTAITVMKWNFLGKRLVTGDKNGTVVVWAVDSRGGLNRIRQYYKKESEITALVFCLLPLKNDFIQRNKTDKNTYSPSFFFGTNQGSLVYADDLGHCTDVQTLNSWIDTLMFFEEKSRLVLITRSFLLRQYYVTEDGRVSDVMDLKISVPGDIADRGIQSVVWAGPGLLAAATEEKFVRMLDLPGGESYNVSLVSALGESVDKSDKVTCIGFSPVDRYLAVGTLFGLVVIWKYRGYSRNFNSKSNTKSGDNSTNESIPATSAADWELIFKTQLMYPILQLVWYSGRGALAAVTEEGTVVLNESVLSSGMAGDLTVVQVGNTEVALNLGGPQDCEIINTGIQIRGISLSRSCFVVWSGKVAKIYKVDMQLQKFDSLDPIRTSGMAMVIADNQSITDEAWFIAEQSLIKINNFEGTQKGSISCSEAEGLPEFLDINGRFLVIVTSKGYIKILDVNKPTQPKQIGTAGQFFSVRSSVSVTGSQLKIRQVRVNCSGTRVAILADIMEGVLRVCHPDTRLHVYDRNKGTVLLYDFQVANRCPTSIFWDDHDDRLLSCEATSNRLSTSTAAATTTATPVPLSTTTNEGEVSEPKPKSESELNSPDLLEGSDVEVYLFFATSENGILMQDSFPRKHPCGTMIGLQVPRLYFRNSIQSMMTPTNEDEVHTPNSSKNVKIYSKVMRDFVGMDEINEDIKVALLDFSYNLTLGKLDEAYRAVKAIDSPGIWENMAQMCVKTKRLDVAEVCLGNMGHVRGAAAVRESKKEGNLEVTVGVLAIQLGLLDDAARLFREGNRFDLLNKLYQTTGLWEKAIQVATTRDRIHLKTTHYQFAKYLESIGEIDEAIAHYELSETSRNEVPRMLFHLGQVEQLGEYVMKSDDPALLKWWAAYLESIERYDKARKFYSKAGDYLSLVRISCFRGDFNKAAEIVAESGDRASAYHFARQLENQGEYQDAINFYATSGCYNHSIRLAKIHNLDSELMRFALKSTSALMIECAIHFEAKGEFDKAVQLYHKGGDIPRALDLCFRVGEESGNKSSQSMVVYDMLNTIAQDLGADSSPQMLARCADFLVQHKQFEKAIELYVIAKRYHQAVEMCLQHKVTISDEMVEKLTPSEQAVDALERKEILKDLAKVLKKQGSFTMASKKYTQAGDRVRAIKCLVRSGDTKAVIQFTNISRNLEIYKLAANYLQQMNWRESVDIMKAIITFYNKAKAFYQLAGFYDSCAQVEIDEYRDYEKAIGALKEALKYLAKDTAKDTADEIRNYMNSIEKRILIIDKFVQARKMAKKEPEKMVAICSALLEEPLLEEAIRAGDCLAMLVEYYHGAGMMKEAYGRLKEMEDRRIQLHPYIDAEIIEEVYRKVGKGGALVGKGQKELKEESKERRGVEEEDDDEERDEEDNNRMKSFGNVSQSKNVSGNVKHTSLDEDDDEAVDEEIDEDIVEEDEDDKPKKKNPTFGKNYGGGRGGGRGQSSGGRGPAPAYSGRK